MNAVWLGYDPIAEFKIDPLVVMDRVKVGIVTPTVASPSEAYALRYWFALKELLGFDHQWPLAELQRDLLCSRRIRPFRQITHLERWSLAQCPGITFGQDPSNDRQVDPKGPRRLTKIERPLRLHRSP